LLPTEEPLLLERKQNNMAKSHASQRNRNNGAKHRALKGDSPENRPQNLILYLVTSILLHSVLFFGSDYWFRAFAPKQELSTTIPIEFIEVPPNETKTPPETSRRAAKNSVAGGKAKSDKPISAGNLASTITPKTKSASEPSEVLLPQQTQQKTVLSNPPAQKLQPKPQKIAITPVTKPLAPLPSPTAVTPETIPPKPLPLPTAITPTTKPLALKLRQRTVAPETIPPEPLPLPTAITPTIKPLALKLRQRTVTPKPQPPKPEPLPTTVAPTTKPLALKPRQRTVTPQTTPLEPEPLPTTVAPTTKPLALKLRQRRVIPETTPLEPEPLPTTVAPTTKPLALKPRQRTVTPQTTQPVPFTRPENRSQLAAKSSPEEFENRTNSLVSPETQRIAPSRSQSQSTASPRKLSRSQTSAKSGAASSLGGTVSLSSRDFGTNNLAALPNSNRLNRGTQGVDARQDVDMSAYLQQLQERVKQQWIPGLTQSSQQTVLSFIVSRAGLVSNLQVVQSSGLSMTDEAALNAVNRAVPFASFPTEYPQNYIKIQFTFNINVYGQLELLTD
jgi:TonB family protein